MLVRGDIHKNNIIINKEDYTYKYEFDKKLYYKPITVKINFKLYLIDFDNSDFFYYMSIVHNKCLRNNIELNFIYFYQ